MSARTQWNKQDIPTPGSGPGHIRVIAGRWRGRRLNVADLPGLRPTGDRARETLFNWLQPEVGDARCLDLFAGTGALGFEAASRGAEAVTLVERDPRAVLVLRENAELLSADSCQLQHADVFDWLKDAPADAFELAFIDPPFDDEVAGDALQALIGSGTLARGALVYIETPLEHDAVAIPEGWSEWKNKRVGQVRLQVLRDAAGE